MKEFPFLTAMKKSVVQTTTFRGLNKNAVISDGEFQEMQNLSDKSYPLIDQRKKRGSTSYDPAGQEPVQLIGLHGRDQLIFVRGTEVWYGLTKINNISVSEAPSMIPKKIVSMGAYCCIWPDKVYFNTADLTDVGSMERTWSLASDGSNVNMIMCRGDGRSYSAGDITMSDTAPDSPRNGQLWLDTSGETHVLKQYSTDTDTWTEVATTFVKIEATGIGNGLREYDAVTVSGLMAPETVPETISRQVDALNGSMIIYGCGNDYIIVAGLLSQALYAAEGVTVGANLTIPDLQYVCESNNRLWGCFYGIGPDGSVINEIRASKLGDFRNWNCFMGLSTDSYAVNVGTDGVFTGAVQQKGYPVIFKENCIHRIAGTDPSNFSVSTTMCRGIQEGSWRSAVVVNEQIIYKARDGIMMYDGSLPISISTALGAELYKNARAGAVAGHYYISMQDEGNQWHLLNYDTLLQLWHEEDNFRALEFGTVDDELYAIDENNNTLVSMLGSMGTAEGDLDWSAVFGLFGTDYTNQKYLSRFNIRMQMQAGSWVHMFIQYDSDGIWTDEGEIRGTSTKTFMIPVTPRRCDHLQIKIEGHGPCKIYSISRELEVGTDG